MKILMIGNYELEKYARGRIIYKGLKKNGANVEIVLGNPAKIAKRLLNFDFDIIIASGKPILWAAFLLKPLHKKKIIFDAFISDYDNLVIDRKIVKNPILSRLLWFGDKYSCAVSDKVILDTNEHIKYFCQEFGLNRQKFDRVFIGADGDILKIKEEEGRENRRLFEVLFYGTYIPVHGIDYILKAAAILESKDSDIEFTLIGNGQTYNEMIKLNEQLQNKNCRFIDFINQEELLQRIYYCNVCLGIFGSTPRAKRAIPNKVFDAISMKKPVISSKTAATTELFKDKINILYSKIADEEDLAEKILLLKSNNQLINSISENGYRLFLNKLDPKSIGKVVLIIINTSLLT